MNILRYAQDTGECGEMKKVSVIGHFGFGTSAADGQTIKTRIFTDELARQLGEREVERTDTRGGVKTLFKAPVQVFRALKGSNHVVMLPAHNGLRVYGPLLVLGRCFFRGRKLYYIVIGGWLSEFVRKRKWLAGCLKAFDGIYVETVTMKNALEAQGFGNIYVMPNCKNLRILREDELVYPEGAPYKLCTFSRVMKEKGIEDAVNAVRAVNETLGKIVYTLDIYGPVDAAQTAWFDALQANFPEYVTYQGCVEADKSVEILKNYFALLFPTYYAGEGLAGSLIDTFAAGVPVIASDWKYNPEIVTDTTGAVYPTGDQTALVNILLQAANEPRVLLNLKPGCLEEAYRYLPVTAMQVITDHILDV